MDAVEPQVRIAHISDLHAKADSSADAYGQQRVVSALLEDLAERGTEREVDLFVFSGDLSFDGTETSLRRGREILLDPLRNAHPAAPIVLTPGNHDVNLDKIDHALDQGLDATLTSREAVQERLGNPDSAALDRRRLEDWDRFTQEWDPGCKRTTIGPGAYEHRLEVAGRQVAVGSFDTAWRSRDSKEDRGRLLLGVDQLRSFLKGAEGADLIIATFHHPPDWLNEFGRSDVRTALEQVGAVVLTGHDHVPDPTLCVTPRGSALYCRAPCSYEHPDYSNGYALIDISLEGSSTEVTMRRWAPQSDRFVADLDSAPEDGSFKLPWPASDALLPVYHLPEREVIKPLVDLAQDHSVLPENAEVADPTSIKDLAIAPRFWPVPYTEVFNRSVEREHRPRPVDPLDEIAGARALILSGPRMSGVTTALLWTLERHYRTVGTHIPAYVQTDSRFSRRRIQQVIDEATERVSSEAPPILLAIDDANPADSRALGRLVRVLRDNPNVTVVLGCHDDADKTLAETFGKLEINARRIYLGPFGRRETRELVARIAGAEGSELVSRILRVVQRQGLPRNPLNLAALVSVLTREPDLTAINESGLLESYVGVLLDNPVPGVDPEGLNMDFRRREHLLQRIAEHVVASERTRIPRTEVEQLVLDYYNEIGWLYGSAGQLIDSLIRRRILAEDEQRGVGFRYPALLHLFAAKAAAENEEFAKRVFAKPLTYAPIIKHVAGLSRSDRDTLDLVLGKARAAREEIATDVKVEEFELIEDRDGWSQINSLDHVHRLLDSRPPPPSEEELDELFEEVADDADEAVELQPFEEQPTESVLEELMASYQLLGAVLQSSELINDLDFRAEALREAIVGWGIMTLILSVEEDRTRAFKTVLAPLFENGGDDAQRDSLIEHVARVFVMTMMATGLYVEVGTVHHEKVLSKLLDDEEFMARSANALFASVLSAMLGFADWPKRLEQCYDLHEDHPMVRELIQRWCLQEYYSPKLPDHQVQQVESLLEKILSHDLPVSGRAGVPARASQSNAIRERLRKTRRDALFSKHSGVQEEIEAPTEDGKMEAIDADGEPEVSAA